MYRVGKKTNAQAHGTYIRPMYVPVWKHMVELAERYHVSVSSFVNFALFVYVTGAEPDDHPLAGKLPFSHEHPLLELKGLLYGEGASRSRKRTRTRRQDRV